MTFTSVDQFSKFSHCHILQESETQSTPNFIQNTTVEEFWQSGNSTKNEVSRSRLSKVGAPMGQTDRATELTTISIHGW